MLYERSRLAPKDFRWVLFARQDDQQDGQIDEAIRNYQMRALCRGVRCRVGKFGKHLPATEPLDEAKENFKAALIIDESSAAALYGWVRSLCRGVTLKRLTILKIAGASTGANRIHYSLPWPIVVWETLKKPERIWPNKARSRAGADPLIDGLRDLIAESGCI